MLFPLIIAFESRPFSSPTPQWIPGTHRNHQTTEPRKETGLSCKVQSRYQFPISNFQLPPKRIRQRGHLQIPASQLAIDGPIPAAHIGIRRFFPSPEIFIVSCFFLPFFLLSEFQLKFQDQSNPFWPTPPPFYPSVYPSGYGVGLWSGRSETPTPTRPQCDVSGQRLEPPVALANPPPQKQGVAMNGHGSLSAERSSEACDAPPEVPVSDQLHCDEILFYITRNTRGYSGYYCYYCYYCQAIP